MKKAFTIFVLVLSILLFGCNKTYTWEFKTNSSEAIQVSIIYIETLLYQAEQIINLPPIKTIEISHIDELYKDVQNLKMKEPLRMELPRQYGYCILIYYGNDNYCILSTEGSGYIYYDQKYKYLVIDSTDLVFNKEDFLNIINKYLEI